MSYNKKNPQRELRESLEILNGMSKKEKKEAAKAAQKYWAESKWVKEEMEKLKKEMEGKK